ncbi:MAG: RHS repeat protein [Victivallales bacterium]|nr:RHS repeat protein [Victivallales bacterium]
MAKRLSLPVFIMFSFASLAIGNEALSFAEHPMLAGRAALTENGFAVMRTIGVANFSPEFTIPVQIIYESSSERKGLFGYGWRSPQLESRAYFAKGGVRWTTPWNQEFLFPLKEGRILPDVEWSASFSGDSPEKAEEWTFTGRNGKRGWTFRYLKARLVGIEAPSGRSQTWTYDGNGRLTAVSQNGQEFIAISYNGALATRISINGVATSLEYRDLQVSILPKVASGQVATPTMPRLVKVMVDGLSPVEFQYGESYLAKTVRGECKEEFTVETETLEERLANLKSRDRKSGVKHTGKVAGRLLRDGTFDYAYADAGPGKVSVTDRKGQSAKYDFDRLKGVFSITDVAGRCTKVFYYMRHDVAYLGRPRKVVDWKGRDVAAWQYDKDTANPVSLVNFIGNETVLSYGADGRLAKAERRANSDSEAEPFMGFLHGERGELLELSTLDVAGKATVTTHFAYDGHLQPVGVSDGRGTVRLFYNDFGYVKKVVGPTGAALQSIEYDSYNRPVAVTDANGVVTRLVRLESGLVSRVERILDNETISFLAVEYDAGGRPLSYTDHRGRRRAFERDGFGRVIKEFLPDGSSIAYSFDAAGNLSRVLDQNRHEIAFDWSAFGLDSRTTAVGQVTDYVHDKFGLLASVSSIQNGKAERKIAYEYDKFDRPVKITYGPGEVETISYDAWGRVASRTRGKRKACYRRDHWGRLVEKEEEGVKTFYTYNEYGQRLDRTVKDARGVATEMRRYDELGRLVEIADGGGNVQFQYDAKGRVVGQSLNGLPVNLTYTRLGLPDFKTWGGSASPVATLKYLYDRDGTLVGREVNGRLQAYVQDSRGQLLAVKDADGKTLEEYRYDPAGNILSKTVNGKTTVFTYDKANQLLTSECDGKVTRFAYDAAGRMVRDGDRGYRYGWLDKVTAVTENDKPYATYDYHVDGQLAMARYADRQEDFLWDGLALVRRNRNSYINEPHPGGGAPVLSSADGAMLNDMLGSSLGTVNKGKDRMSGITAFGETNDNAVFFTGKPMVNGLGYVFLFRNYLPENGKWLTADPIGYPDGWNNSLYCNNCVTFVFDYLGAACVVNRPLQQGGWGTDWCYDLLGQDKLLLKLQLSPAHYAFLFSDTNDGDIYGYPNYSDETRKDYAYTDYTYYDDDLLRTAISNINDTGNWKEEDYSTFSHNCQHYISAVLEEYSRLFNNLPENEQQRITYEKGKIEQYWRTHWTHRTLESKNKALE